MNPRRTITPAVIREMRAWLKDAVNCVPAAVDELSDYQVIRAVELRYWGGIVSFVDDTHPADAPIGGIIDITA